MATIKRKIERVIELTARDVYEALAAKYDLPTNPQDVVFLTGFGEEQATIGLKATEFSEQELS